MNSESFANRIRKCIEKADVGTVFVATDFADIVENSRIGVIFSRLENENVIRRVMRGVYYKAEYNEFLQEYVSPLPDKVAHALLSLPVGEI